MKKITFFIFIFSFALLHAQTPLPAGNYYAPNDPENGSTFYTSLTEAFSAINDNGIAGDITLYINGDINQSANVGLINPSDYTITIRPDKDEDRTILFNQTTDNAGPSGAFCIGIKISRAWADLATAKNIVIDGYAEGGETRRLKIATAATQANGNGAILLINDCQNIQIKNCIVHSEGGTGGTAYGIYLRGDTRYGTNTMPSDVLIENNSITSKKCGAGQAVGVYANAAPGKSLTGLVVRNNYLDARTRGVFLNYVNGVEISGNEFHVVQTNTQTLSSGIMGNAGLSGDIKVFNNNFVELKTYNSTAGDYGMKGIIASGGGNWYIDNNFFSGVDKAYGSGLCMLQIIRVGSPCVIRHNTFYMKPLTKLPADNVENPTATDPSYCAINIAAGEPEIRNNIFVSDEDGIWNFIFRGNPGGNCSDNVLYLKAGNTNARYIPGCSTFDEFQTAYSSTTTNWIDSKVEFEDAGAGNLKIAGTSIQDKHLSVPLIPEVAVDMFGETRENPTYAGAHQSVLPFNVTVGIDEPEKEPVRVISTPYGIEVQLEETSVIELYGINGQLIEKTTAYGTYSRNLDKGMYILRVNGETVKFMR